LHFATLAQAQIVDERCLTTILIEIMQSMKNATQQ